MTHAPNVRRLFRGLEVLYGSATGIDPEDHLVRAAPGIGREALWVRQADDALEVAVVLEPRVLDRFEGQKPDRVLHAVGDSLPVIEGLSHLLYLAESARRERPISGLELETQAEVDKLAIHSLHRWPLHAHEYRELVDRLYYRFSLVPGLSDSLQARYHQANRVALAFSRRLLPHISHRRLGGFHSALRQFWGGSMSDKRTLARTTP